MKHSGIPVDRWNTYVQDQIAAQLAMHPSRKPAEAQGAHQVSPATNKPSGASGQGKAGILMELPYPPSANRYWRSIVIKGHVRVLLSTAARHYKRMVAELASYMSPPLPGPLEGPLRMTLKMYRPQKSGDLSNRIKVVEDALNGIAYRDDRQIVEIQAFRYDDKASPRVLVLVEQVP